MSVKGQRENTQKACRDGRDGGTVHVESPVAAAPEPRP